MVETERGRTVDSGGGGVFKKTQKTKKKIKKKWGGGCLGGGGGGGGSGSLCRVRIFPIHIHFHPISAQIIYFKI